MCVCVCGIRFVCDHLLICSFVGIEENEGKFGEQKMFYPFASGMWRRMCLFFRLQLNRLINWLRWAYSCSSEYVGAYVCSAILQMFNCKRFFAFVLQFVCYCSLNISSQRFSTIYCRIYKLFEGHYLEQSSNECIVARLDHLMDVYCLVEC